MEYLKISWLHRFEDQPIFLYSEIDNQRFENRKIEIYEDGSFGIANCNFHFGGTALSDLVMPEIADISGDKQFFPELITQAEFELIWNQYYYFLS
ncbi:MAG: hypothetical protein J7623_14915 [Chitinophaga sp.]|uniref:DUF6881 domain-containing protein n=1 Tax=Chitinophaga sp. TaxID=1869181 RepID=UPI001AFFE059|nr:hypothetical protein [Chitinophaga sp.]MBO9729927.1 hypothetical protein [Chitinophaga sp.]